MATEPIIHWVGPKVFFGDVSRQRCMWCGALIEETDWSLVAIQIDSSASEEVQKAEVASVRDAEWTGLVEVSGTNPVTLSAVDQCLQDDEKAPDRACMRLLPPEVVPDGGV